MIPPDDPFYKALGRQIQTYRNSRGLTQEALGARLDPPVTRASVANLEAGKQRLLVHTLVQIAEILGLGLHELLPDAQVVGGGSPSAAEFEQELASKLDLPRAAVKKLARKMNKVG